MTVLHDEFHTYYLLPITFYATSLSRHNMTALLINLTNLLPNKLFCCIFAPLIQNCLQWTRIGKKILEIRIITVIRNPIIIIKSVTTTATVTETGSVPTGRTGSRNLNGRKRRRRSCARRLRNSR